MEVPDRKAVVVEASLETVQKETVSMEVVEERVAVVDVVDVVDVEDVEDLDT